MDLNNLTKLKGKYVAAKRKGRGIGSGKGGHTSGRGQKGQKAREGHHISSPGFEGGQTPLYKRLPKFGGFNNPTRKDILSVRIDALNVFEDGSTVTIKDLINKGIIKRKPRFGVKLLASGKLKKKLNLNGFIISEGCSKLLTSNGSKAINE